MAQATLYFFKTPKIHTGALPKLVTKGYKKSYYRNLFSKMKVNSWIILKPKELSCYRNAGSRYLKGKYSIQKHATKANTYIFIRTKR